MSSRAPNQSLLLALMTLKAIEKLNLLAISFACAGLMHLPHACAESPMELPMNGKIDLAPLKLDSARTGSSQASVAPLSAKNIEAGKKTVFKGEIRSNKFVPKNLIEAPGKPLAPLSIKEGAPVKGTMSSESLSDQSQKIKMVPLPLMSSSDNSGKVVDKQRELERKQILALWQATLARSPDIHFVIQKLLPAHGAKKVTSAMVRIISTTMYGGLGAANMVAPGMGTSMATNAIGHILDGIMRNYDRGVLKKERIKDQEQIQMFEMVRGVGNDLVDRYRLYKTTHKEFVIAQNELADLKSMAGNPGVKKNASEQIELEYNLKRQQREMVSIQSTIGKHRQALVEHAGPEAIQKLDKEIELELKTAAPQKY